MNTTKELDEYLYIDLKELAKQRAKMNRSLSDLIKLFYGIGIGVSVLMFILLITHVSSDGKFYLTRFINHEQILTFTYLGLLGLYYFIKHRFEKKIWNEYELIKRNYKDQGLKGHEINTMFDKIYSDVCHGQELNKSRF